MRARTALILLAALPLVLGACSTVKESLGLAKNPPDEFAVNTNPRLAMPPDFRLRPPEPGARPTQDLGAAESTRVAIFREAGIEGSAVASSGRSDGEVALLGRMGAQELDPDDRESIDAEHATTSRAEAMELLREALGDSR